MSRKRFLIVGAICVVTFIIGVSLLFWITDPGVREQTLPDGSLMVLRGVTYGTEHRLVSGNVFERSAARLLPEPFARRLGIQILTHTNDHPVLVVWIEHLRQGTTRRPPGGYTATPIIVSDGEGTEFEQVGSSIGSRGSNSLVEGFVFGTFPRASRLVNIRVRPMDYATRQYHEASFSLPNPAFAPGRSGKPTTYPVRVEQDELTFILHRFTRASRPGRRSGQSGPEAWMNTLHEIVERDKATNGWHVRGIRVMDESGGSYWPSAQGGLPEITRTNFDFRGGLSTNVPWRLRFSLARTSYASNELFTARDVPIPGRSERRFEPVSAALQGVTLTVTGFRVRNNVAAEISPPDENLRLELVRAVDEQGREIKPGSTGLSGRASYSFGLQLPTNATAVDLTFAVLRNREIEITARPQPGTDPGK